MSNVKKSSKKILFICFISIAALLALISFFGRFLPDGIFRNICNFFVGSFGMSFFAGMVVAVTASIFLMSGKNITMPTKYVINSTVMFVVLVLLVHLYSTIALINMDYSFDKYIAICYDYYLLPTFGGVVWGSVVYMLESLLTVWGASILLFAILAFNILFTVNFLYDYQNHRSLFNKRLKKVVEEKVDFVPKSPVFDGNGGINAPTTMQSETPSKTMLSLHDVGIDTPDSFYPNNAYDTEDTSTTLEIVQESSFQPEQLFSNRAQNSFFNNTKFQEEEEDDEKHIEDIIVSSDKYTNSQTAVESAESNNTVKNSDLDSYFMPKSFDNDLYSATNNQFTQKEEPVIDLMDSEAILGKQNEPEVKRVENNSVDILKPMFTSETVEKKVVEHNVANDNYQDDTSFDFEKELDAVSTANNELSVTQVETTPIKVAPVIVVPKEEIPVQEEVKELETVIEANQVAIDLKGNGATEREEITYLPYVAPDLSLLGDPEPVVDGDEQERLDKAEAIIRKFASFKKPIPLKLVKILVGPTFEQYRFELTDSSVQMSSIEGYHKDLQAVLESVSGVRILAPIPGKNQIGVETARKDRQKVMLKSVLESDNFKNSKGRLAFTVGEDVNGDYIVTNLADMPHLLIAGGTGSGKSVMLNCLIVSMLYRYSPDDLRFFMIDPKQVELAKYAGLPHLLTSEPVCSLQNDAMAVMDYLIKEMDSRYKLFKTKGANSIIEYNSFINQKFERKLPNIVLVVDELADLMAVCKAEFEKKLLRLVQMCRGAGIHLILATQRPSADIINGTIKNNFACRIALRVGSAADSGTIIGGGGAEKLLGWGDMLFIGPQSSVSYRIQAPYIDGREILDIVSFIKERNVLSLDDSIEKSIFLSRKAAEPEPTEPTEVGDAEDPLHQLCKPAMLYWINRYQGRASISSLQRGLAMGFNRAGKLFNYIEDLGYIEPINPSDPSSKVRKLLLTAEEVEELFPD